jgi:hypothetical protein
MSSTDGRSARELIAELCDGLIQQDDRSRLEELLRDDPILQHEYLDQAMIDGVLRYEFGIDSPTIPDQFATYHSRSDFVKLSARSLIVLLFAVIVASGYWWLNRDLHLEIPIQLANVSFENDLPISNEPIRDGWYGDVARIVFGNEDNLAPDGKHMLQLIRSVHQPSKECEVYQVLDLRQSPTKTLDRPAYIEATVTVNTRSFMGDEPYLLSLELYICTELPELQHRLAPQTWSSDMTTAGSQVAADSDPDSWQEIRLVMPLSRDAKFGIVKISVRDTNKLADDEFSEVFVDNVQVRLTNKGLL